MSSTFDRLVKDLIGAMKVASSPKTSPLDTTAEVVRVEDGIAWVHLPGGVDETPVSLTVAVSPGDTVQVRINSGKAWITGNATAPPTDDKKAIEAGKVAQGAQEKVNVVQEVAERADSKAKDALKLAEGTNEHFWHNETGAHITQVTQEEYEDDPANAGGNLLMTSQGMAVRDGQTELATFTGTAAQIGKSSQWNVVTTSNGVEITPPSSQAASFPNVKLTGESSDYSAGLVIEKASVSETLYAHYNQVEANIYQEVGNIADEALINPQVISLSNYDNSTDEETLFQVNNITKQILAEDHTLKVGGIRVNNKPLLKVREVVSVDNQTIAASATNSYYDQKIALTADSNYTGYTPIGVIDYLVENATTSGVGCSWCHVYKCGLVNESSTYKVSWGVRNMGSIQVKIKLTARVLYAATGIV